MRKRLKILVFFIAGWPLVSQSQPYGNEWINFSQQYYKITTAEDGIYRITYDDLITAGFPVSTVDPGKIMLFHRGEELAIYIEGQDDARLDPPDYIEFYGRRNDGALDEEIYIKPEAQPHKYYNIYSDTTAYFLTWSLIENGKRMSYFKEENTSGLPAEPYHLEERLNLYTDNYSIGLHYPIGVPSAETYLTEFDYGEGWTGTAFRQGQSRDVAIAGIDQVVTSGPNPVLEVLLAGRNNLAHDVVVEVGPDAGSLRLLKEIKFNYYYTFLMTDTIEWSDISGGNFMVRVTIKDNGVADRVSISYVKLKFAAAWDQGNLQQKVYRLAPNGSGRSYVEIQNVPSGAMIYDITDERNVINIGYNINGAAIDAMLPNDTKGRKLFLTSRRIPVPKIQQISMRNLQPAGVDYVIVTHKLLRQPSANYADVPRAYAAYRASPQGGGYDTMVVNMDDLYNMFSYGEYTSLAMHRFARFLADKGDPQYIFIMGKGLNPAYNFFRLDQEAQPARDLIPTGGYPGNDIIYTAGLKGSTYEPGIPIGRVAATTPQVLESYFEKVKEMEAGPYNELWRKELVHVSGGRDPFQQQIFRTYVDGMKAVVEGPLLGGDVVTFSKTVTGPTQLINISDVVNDGKVLITFFGHSGTQSTDVDIGKVSNDSYGYSNKGKYPMMLVNGCIAGDMFNMGFEGFGEDWINTPDKGAIGFIAHTGSGLTSRLKIYSDLFYEVAFTDSLFLAKGVGEIVKEVGKRYLEKYSDNEINISQIQQMALQGDPAVALVRMTKTDYEINQDNIFVQAVDDQPINVFTPVFNLGLIVRNLGITNEDSLKITVVRKLSGGQELALDTLVYGPVYYKDTLYFPIKNVGLDGFGNNRFTVYLDPLGEIPEFDDMNNSAFYDYFLLLGGTRNAFPANYSVINKNEIRLVAQSLNLLADDRTYLFEIDTTAGFDSPVKRQNSIQGAATAKWTVSLFDNLPVQDTVVFYWRTKFSDPRPDELNIWMTTSFVYIKNSPPGWAMTHFEQFQGNKLDNIVLNDQNRQWEFQKFNTDLYVRTFGASHPNYNYENVQLTINNTEYIFPTRLCTDNSVNMVAFDKVTTLPYLVLGRSFILDRRSCGRQPQVINNMLKNEIEGQLKIEEYIDKMGDGDYVLMFSIGNVTYQSWPATTIAKLEAIGVSASQLQNLQNGEPVIILGKKGTIPGSATVIKADYTSPDPATEQEITMVKTITGQAVSGTVSSPKIGPAASWSKFYQQTGSLESPTLDQYTFDIYGVDKNNNESLLFGNVQLGQVDLTSVDATTYPFMRLQLNLSDEQDLTPAQLKKWIVLFDGYPDGVLSYKPGQEIENIEKMEGEVHEVSFIFDNIGELPFTDSIAVEYRLFNHDSRTTFADTFNIKPLGGREMTDFAVYLETLKRTGLNDLKVFANPYLQPEHNYNNNIIQLPDYLNVMADNINPILEVTVDGQFIMDGDIVSPSPVITLRLKDENDVLFKEDTLGVNLYLNKKCENCEPARISFSSPNVTWTPATKDNDFMVEFRPDKLEDGIYTLRAEASDASGNPSGTEPYAVSFEVINESQITNFFPYPNPFSTRTQFVFTLTGSEIPDEIYIQIMTVNGTVVKEITQDEIGPIHIGNNKTEYAWDGCDQYGDQLANGVYLYKVKVYKDGKEMKMRATSADRAFKHGYGKLYLLR